jgi:hypothetical protein
MTGVPGDARTQSPQASSNARSNAAFASPVASPLASRVAPASRAAAARAIVAMPSGSCLVSIATPPSPRR